MGRDHTLFAVEKGYVRFYQPNPLPTVDDSATTSKIAGLAMSQLQRQTALPVSELVKPHPSSRRRKTGRRYVGVVLQRDDPLPLPHGVPRSRRLGLINVAKRASAFDSEWIDEHDGDALSGNTSSTASPEERPNA